MNRIVVYFDISHMYDLVLERVDDLYARMPELQTRHAPDRLVEQWFRHQLERVHYLALLPPSGYASQVALDSDFLHDQFLTTRLYGQVSPFLHPAAHPCFESWCRVTVTANELILTFYLDPIDYSA